MTIPPEVEQRVRDYFAALLSPPAARAALTDVMERLPLNASPSVVFIAAHKALQDRLRVRPEVEADVLVEEAGLSVSDAANVLGLRVRDVREALDAAAAAAAALDRTLSEPGTTRGTGNAVPDHGVTESVVTRGGGKVGPAVGGRGESVVTRGRGGGEVGPAVEDRGVSEPVIARRSGDGTPDHSLIEPGAAPVTETEIVGGDAGAQRLVIAVDEEVDAETLETVERSRAGAVLVLVLAVAIAVAALVVAAQGT